MAISIGAAYVRVSTDDQLEYSPDSQLKLIRDHAKRDKVIIPYEYVYTDGGISGKSADKRPQFRLMIATAKQDPPPFSKIYVWKFSRFARNQEEAIMYKNLLRKRGVDVVSISEPSSDSPFSSLIERIIEWMDEYYVINLAEETRRGMKEKSLRGEAMGHPPFGYDVKDKVFVPNEDADSVKWIFDQYLLGKSFRQIAVESGRFTNQTVRYVLSNPAYVGKIRWNDDGRKRYQSMQYVPDISDMPEGKHEPIIDMDTWNAVQDRLRSRQTSTPRVRKNRPPFLFQGLVRCSECGGTLIKMQQKGRAHALQCYHYNAGTCRTSQYIRVDELTEIVIGKLEEIVEDGTYHFSAPKAKSASIDTEKLNRYISNERARIQRAKNAYLDGIFTEEEYTDTKTQSEQAIEKYQSMMDVEPEIDVRKLKDKTENVIDTLRSEAPDELKNRALRSIIDKIVVCKPLKTLDIFFAISFEN